MSYIANLHLDSPSHYGIDHAGQTLDWLPSDSEQVFQQNIKNPQKKKYLESRGWHVPGCFQYKINQHGFRTTELHKNAHSVVALGCSFTVGIGLPIEDAWPSILAEKLNKTVYNLGVGGASLDTVFRIADHWLPKIQPSAVILLAPPIHRFEVYHNQKADVYTPIDNHRDLVKQWFSSDDNALGNAKKNILAIESISNSLDIPFFVFNSDDIGNKSYARDFLHQGPEDHTDIACNMLDNGVSNV